MLGGGFVLDRRRFLVALLGGFASALNSDYARAVERRLPTKKPNVLFIWVDDLNAWIGELAAHPQTRTP